MKKLRPQGNTKGPRCAQAARQRAFVATGRIHGGAKTKAENFVVRRNGRAGKSESDPFDVGGRRAFADYPSGSRQRALLRKHALTAYFVAILNGKTRTIAERSARGVWMRESGKNLTGRSVRRWADKIERAGGMRNAPLTAYLDRKSCPHVRARKDAGVQHGEK